MNLEEKDMIQNPDIQADRPEDAVQKTPEAKAQRRPARKPAQRTNAVRREQGEDDKEASKKAQGGQEHQKQSGIFRLLQGV